MINYNEILEKDELGRDEIRELLAMSFEDAKQLFKKANEVKEKYVDKKTYFRGLVELSNYCAKNCLYCGIRKDNHDLVRYIVSDEDVLKSVRFAWENNYASVVIQSGELQSPAFTKRISSLIAQIMEMTKGEIGITLSLGEQTLDVYKEWHELGARRYLLRIETSNRQLYAKLHPNDELHDYDRRLQALRDLRQAGFQVGTGVMIGVPFQILEHLVDDIIFMRDFDIDMCGMGPYIEHRSAPLFQFSGSLLPLEERFFLTLKMIAVLRIIMKDINIAASTAMQASDKLGREKALYAGANIIMPNITPGVYRDFYKLYENKPCTDEQAEDCLNCIEARVTLAGDSVGWGEHGDSPHFKNRMNSDN